MGLAFMRELRFAKGPPSIRETLKFMGMKSAGIRAKAPAGTLTNQIRVTVAQA